MDQFNIDITSNDFNVEPIVKGDDFAILVSATPLFYPFICVCNTCS